MFRQNAIVLWDILLLYLVDAVKIPLYLKTKRILFLLQGTFEEQLKVGSGISYSFAAEILTALC